MGNQFKNPLQNLAEPASHPMQNKAQQFVNVLQKPQQPVTTLFPEVSQQGTVALLSLERPSPKPFQPQKQQQMPPSPVRAQQFANTWQSMERPRSTSDGNKENAAVLSRQDKTKQRQKHRRISTLTYSILGCTVCLLLLLSGSYWYYQTNAATPSAQNPQTSGSQPQAMYKGDGSPAGTNNGNQKSAGTVNKLSPQVYSGPSTPPMAISAQNGLIVISISEQQLTVYNQGKVVYFSLVTTGQIAAYTPTGTFHVIGRTTNRYFGPPAGSSLHYAPEHINFALQLTTNGIFIHDSAWRSVYGPGTNKPHNDPKFGEETGSHGCINTPYSVALWLYKSIANGTTVQIVD